MAKMISYLLTVAVVAVIVWYMTSNAPIDAETGEDKGVGITRQIRTVIENGGGRVTAFDKTYVILTIEQLNHGLKITEPSTGTVYVLLSAERLQQMLERP